MDTHSIRLTRAAQLSNNHTGSHHERKKKKKKKKKNITKHPIPSRVMQI